MITGSPRRLLLVMTGNTSSMVLRAVVEDHLAAIVQAFTRSAFVELRATALVVHADRQR